MISDRPTRINSRGIEVMDISDGAWATYVAEGKIQLAESRAALAEARHQVEIVKIQGIAEIDARKFNSSIIEAAEAQHASNPGQSVDDIIEGWLEVGRQNFLATFTEMGDSAPTGKPGNLEASLIKILKGD